MKLIYAKRLHNNDHVTVKRTGETVEVLNISYDEKNVWIEVVTSDEGFETLHHTEVK